MKRPVGLVVHPKHSLLAATPHGIVREELIVEVKCPKRTEGETLQTLSQPPVGQAASFWTTISSLKRVIHITHKSSVSWHVPVQNCVIFFVYGHQKKHLVSV